MIVVLSAVDDADYERQVREQMADIALCERFRARYTSPEGCLLVPERLNACVMELLACGASDAL